MVLITILVFYLFTSLLSSQHTVCVQGSFFVLFTCICRSSLTHIFRQMNNLVAKSSENSQFLAYFTAWKYWHCWALPLVRNTFFFLLALELSHSGTRLSVSFAGFSSPSHPLNTSVPELLHGASIFSFAYSLSGGSHQPHGFFFL